MVDALRIRKDVEKIEAELRGLRKASVNRLLEKYLRLTVSFEVEFENERDELICRKAALMMIQEISQE